MQITRGVIPSALKVLIYGPEGIGKTTLASRFPDPVFIDTEGSTKQMDVARLPSPESWSDILNQVKYIANRNACKTLVIDTADWAEMFCMKALCGNDKSIEDFGYGKGYVMLAERFKELLDELNKVIDAGIHVVLTAHAQMRKFEQPDEMGAYDRWELKMQKKTAPLVKEWADMILFCNYRTHVIEKDGKKKARGGERVMYTTHHPCWDAKNRFGLPEVLPMEFDAIASVVGVPEAPQVPDELKSLMDRDGVTDEDIRFLAVTKAWVTDTEIPLYRYKKELIDFIVQNWEKVRELTKSETIPFEEED